MWWTLTHERLIGLYFFDQDIIASNSFLHTLKNYVLPHLNSNNSLKILQLHGAPLHFAHIVNDCLTENFPRPWTGRARPVPWHFVLLILRIWTSFFGAVCKTKWTRWLNSMNRSLQQLQMLQRACYRASGKGRTVGGMYVELQMALNVKCSACGNFSTCVQKNCLSWQLHCKYRLRHICFPAKVTGVTNRDILFGTP